MKKRLDLEGVEEDGLPQKLLSGVYDIVIVEIDIISIERENGYRCVTTEFVVEFEDGKIHRRVIQLAHPGGVLPYSKAKRQECIERDKSKWKACISSLRLKDVELDILLENFYEYPRQDGLSKILYYHKLLDLKGMVEESKEEISFLLGRSAICQIVDRGAKDEKGEIQKWGKNRFLSETGALHIISMYPRNERMDCSLNKVLLNIEDHNG